MLAVFPDSEPHQARQGVAILQDTIPDVEWTGASHPNGPGRSSYARFNLCLLHNSLQVHQGHDGLHAGHRGEPGNLAEPASVHVERCSGYLRTAQVNANQEVISHFAHSRLGCRPKPCHSESTPWEKPQGCTPGYFGNTFGHGSAP